MSSYFLVPGLTFTYFLCLDTKKVTKKNQDVGEHPATAAFPKTAPSPSRQAKSLSFGESHVRATATPSPPFGADVGTGFDSLPK